ncbi:MAG: MoxR family ATPase [Candidatus Goldbacteria bacterium]|nr:MoxR family ATPase [Candidatus Goldiibacteriota bacterium]
MAKVVKLSDKDKEKSEKLTETIKEVQKVIVGQEEMIKGLLIGLLCRGHILLEGVPGLAKTMCVKVLAKTIQAEFSRIQFTPDLLPADLIGTRIYNANTGNFSISTGPIFANIVLADEINRAPAKVQSALLEAMQEKQVTIGEKTFTLDEPFIVLATQNPIETEGTYPLPEAQVDRFLMKILITYPDKHQEIEIINRMTTGEEIKVETILKPKDILDMRSIVDNIYVDEKIKEYVTDIVFATRKPQDYKLDLAHLIEYGCSPRASIGLIMAAKANAFINGQGYVSPDDVKNIAHNVLRHRIILSYEAEAEEITTDDVIKQIINKIKVP